MGKGYRCGGTEVHVAESTHRGVQPPQCRAGARPRRLAGGLHGSKSEFDLQETTRVWFNLQDASGGGSPVEAELVDPRWQQRQCSRDSCEQRRWRARDSRPTSRGQAIIPVEAWLGVGPISLWRCLPKRTKICLVKSESRLEGVNRQIWNLQT
jgi:hypothetical protein